MSAFGLDELDALDDFYREQGYVILRGLWDDARLDEIQAACDDLQARLLAGELAERYGTAILVDDEGERASTYVNYVTYVTELSGLLHDVSFDPVIAGLVERWLGAEHWFQESTRFGVVYQDARPGRESSYTRIGWHSDWQAGPHLDVWPSVAFTIHLDETSPANGFLRVVPGSHRWATPAPYDNVNGAVVPDGAAPAAGHTAEPPPMAMPLGFEKVPGEVAVYCDRGDVIFHDAYLWHSAARATDDAGVRRHLRGGWFSGTQLDPARGEWLDVFVKNAAR
jgi:ectoine hydroxylase-related dioxygenase (phytanoyl-CoA dioxygenase family)